MIPFAVYLSVPQSREGARADRGVASVKSRSSIHQCASSRSDRAFSARGLLHPRCYTCDFAAFFMKFSRLLPPPIRQFVRDRMTVFVYTYGFRPSRSVEEQILTFSFGGRALTARSDYRTALYDMIAEVVDYDCYQLKKLEWEPHRDHFIVDTQMWA
jgi:hypothetical protein